MAGGAADGRGPDDGRDEARVVPIGSARSAGVTLRHDGTTAADAALRDAHLLDELHGLLAPDGALRDRLDRREVLLHLLERQRTRRRHRSA